MTRSPSAPIPSNPTPHPLPRRFAADVERVSPIVERHLDRADRAERAIDDRAGHRVAA